MRSLVASCARIPVEMTGVQLLDVISQKESRQRIAADGRVKFEPSTLYAAATGRATAFRTHPFLPPLARTQSCL